MKEDVLLEITRCGEITQAKENGKHPCHKIVTSQSDLGITDFRLPEPWNGHIETAEILFVSSNPSIDKNEHYPTESMNLSKESLIEFFETRFDKIMKFNGKTQRYWYYMNLYTGWILGKSGDNLLKDYAALTEIVHCKSTQEKFGVSKCCDKCAELWFEKILKLFNGKYIVLIGNYAQEYCKKINSNYTQNKTVICMPAPAFDRLTNPQRQEKISEQIKKLS